MREINKINERELELGATASWHDEYKGEVLAQMLRCRDSQRVLSDSAYIFVGGIHLDLTEGDVISIFSQ